MSKRTKTSSSQQSKLRPSDRKRRDWPELPAARPTVRPAQRGRKVTVRSRKGSTHSVRKPPRESSRNWEGGNGMPKSRRRIGIRGERVVAEAMDRDQRGLADGVEVSSHREAEKARVPAHRRPRSLPWSTLRCPKPRIRKVVLYLPNSSSHSPLRLRWTGLSLSVLVCTASLALLLSCTSSVSSFMFLLTLR